MKWSEQRREFLGDIIIAAVEGGTGYWARVSQYQYTFEHVIGDKAGTKSLTVYHGEREGDETRATLHEVNDDETGYKPEGLALTLGAVAAGLGKLKHGEVQINQRLLETILQADRENDAGDIDADAADVIAQAALLGEVRYG